MNIRMIKGKIDMNLRRRRKGMMRKIREIEKKIMLKKVRKSKRRNTCMMRRIFL